MTPIPYCRSEYLQDFSIELGLQKERRQRWHPQYAVDVCEYEGAPLERLTLWIESYYSTEVTLTLWEDREIFVRVALLPTQNHGGYAVEFFRDLELFTFPALIEAMDATASVATRLCYLECPAPLLRKFWRYNGDVEISGNLAQAAAS